MQPIFIATDFSSAALQATDYAVSLAKHLNTAIRLIHCYTVPYMTAENPVALIGINELREIAEKQLEKEVARITPHLENVKVTTHLLIGDAVDAINDIAEDENPLLIVMGSSGETDDFLWGSTAVRALRHLQYPVLAVPKDTVWKNIHHLCLTTDYASIANQDIVSQLTAWKAATSAHLHVLHVDKPGNIKALPVEIEATLRHLQPQFHSVENDNIENGIQEYLSENPTDWMIVIPREYGFFENLFHTSKTKIIAQSSTVPTLAIHAK